MASRTPKIDAKTAANNERLKAEARERKAQRDKAAAKAAKAKEYGGKPSATKEQGGASREETSNEKILAKTGAALAEVEKNGAEADRKIQEALAKATASQDKEDTAQNKMISQHTAEIKAVYALAESAVKTNETAIPALSESIVKVVNRLNELEEDLQDQGVFPSEDMLTDVANGAAFFGEEGVRFDINTGILAIFIARSMIFVKVRRPENTTLLDSITGKGYKEARFLDIEEGNCDVGDKATADQKWVLYNDSSNVLRVAAAPAAGAAHTVNGVVFSHFKIAGSHDFQALASLFAAMFASGISKSALAKIIVLFGFEPLLDMIGYGRSPSGAFQNT